MSDEGRDNGERPRGAAGGTPPERFANSGRPPRRPVQGPPPQRPQGGPQQGGPRPPMGPQGSGMPPRGPQGGPPPAPGWRPGAPPPVPGGPTHHAGPPRQPGSPQQQGPQRDALRRDRPRAEAAAAAPTAAVQREPGLLTHGDSSSPPPPEDTVDNASDSGDRPRRRLGWRRVRRFAIVACLLGVLAPVLAFLVGWVIYDVPSPAALAAARKQVTTLYYSDGQTEIGRYIPEEGNRIEVPIDRVPVHVQNAVLAAEDRSFRSNPGFDVMGIGRAAVNQLTGGSGGGSTITQQYVKNATGNDAISYLRKYREVVVAAKMTKENSKDQILEDYLNIIYFGRGAYGIQAASQAYFGKDVQELTPSEGALLAGVIQSPSRWDPAKNPGQAMFRWNFVLDGMVGEGWMSKQERAAQQFPVTVPPEQAAPGSPGDDRAHIINQALDELEEQGFSRDQLAVNGGKVITSIDPAAQQAARDAVLTELDGQPENLHSSLVAIDPKTGGVLAYYGGQDGVGFDLAGGPAWSPGSSFKPFTMMAALKQDIGINAIYDGDSPLTIQGIDFANSESESYDALTLREAMTQSVNTTFVQLADDVGPQAVRDAALQAGIPAEINGEKSLVEAKTQEPGLGITLGQYPVHTIDMASAFGTIAADGMRTEPFFVQKYVDSDGAMLFEQEPDPQPAFEESDPELNTQLARNVTATLTRVAASSGIPLDGGREVAAKTGTHQLGDTGSNSAAWTVGYTPSISTAVWVGDPANTAIENASGGDVFGKGVPGEIWQRFMNDYLEGTEEESFPEFELLGGAGGPAASQVSDNSEDSETQTSEAPEPSPTPEPSAPPSEEPSIAQDPNAPCGGVPGECPEPPPSEEEPPPPPEEDPGFPFEPPGGSADPEPPPEEPDAPQD